MKVLYLFMYMISICGGFTEYETEIIVSLLKYFQMSHCILVTDRFDTNVFTSTKRMSLYNVVTSHVVMDKFNDLFVNVTKLHTRTAIAFKTKTTGSLHKVFKQYSLNVSWSTWMTFVTNETENIEETIRIPYDCEFLTIKLGNAIAYVTEMYHIKNHSVFKNDLGNWTEQFGLVATTEEFYQRRKDMKGVSLIRGESNRFAVCHNFSLEEKHREIWSAFGNILNFSTISVNEHVSFTFNESSPDGSPCGSAFHALNVFESVVAPTCLVRIRMLFKYESDGGRGWKSYIRPFDAMVWWSLLSWLITSAVALAFIRHYASPNSYFDVFTSFYSICSQDGAPVSEKFSLRIASFMSYVIASFVVPAYSAAILSILTVQLPKVPFTDLEGFARNGGYKMGALNNTFMIKYFDIVDHPLIKHIKKELFIDEKEYPNVMKEVMEKVCENERFVYLDYGGTSSQMNWKCRYFTVRKPVAEIFSAMRLKIGSPFTKIFNQLLQRINMSGQLRKYNATLLTTAVAENDEIALEISQVLPVLFLVPLGAVLSFLCLTVEIAVSKRKIFIPTPL